jgi:hypothetical protein
MLPSLRLSDLLQLRRPAHMPSGVFELGQLEQLVQKFRLQANAESTLRLLKAFFATKPIPGAPLQLTVVTSRRPTAIRAQNELVLCFAHSSLGNSRTLVRLPNPKPSTANSFEVARPSAILARWHKAQSYVLSRVL